MMLRDDSNSPNPHLYFGTVAEWGSKPCNSFKPTGEKWLVKGKEQASHFKRIDNLVFNLDIIFFKYIDGLYKRRGIVCSVRHQTCPS
jgi:hypothetical protein